MIGENPQPAPESDEIRAEEVAAAKGKARINAMTLGLIFLVAALAPSPWNVYAPLLFLLPILYGVYSRMRRPGESGEPLQTSVQVPEAPRDEPYSYTPRDPKDPRRYKPIG